VWCGAPEASKGLGEWAQQHIYGATADHIYAVRNFNGRNAWAFKVVQGEKQGGQWQRSEVGQDGDSTREWHNGEEYWLGYSVWMPKGFPNSVGASTTSTHTCLTQFKDQSPDLGSPSYCTQVRGGQIGFVTHIGCAGCFVWTRPATPDTWHNIVVHVKLGKTASTGLLQVWYSTGDNPVKPVSFTDATKSENRQTYRESAKQVLRMGYYRGPTTTGTAVVYHARMKVIKGAASVEQVTPTP